MRIYDFVTFWLVKKAFHKMCNFFLTLQCSLNGTLRNLKTGYDICNQIISIGSLRQQLSYVKRN